jgi:hypothetical protein
MVVRAPAPNVQALTWKLFCRNPVSDEDINKKTRKHIQKTYKIRGGYGKYAQMARDANKRRGIHHCAGRQWDVGLAHDPSAPFTRPKVAPVNAYVAKILWSSDK